MCVTGPHYIKSVEFVIRLNDGMNTVECKIPFDYMHSSRHVDRQPFPAHSHVVKSRHLIWKWVTDGLNLRVSNLEMCLTDLIKVQNIIRVA